MRTLESGCVAQRGLRRCDWNGKNTAGAVVADGLLIRWPSTRRARAGSRRRRSPPGRHARPGVRSRLLIPGATLSGTQAFVFTPTAGFSGITNVSVDCIGQSDTPAGNGTFTASGDTSVCPEGSNSIAAHVTFTDVLGAATLLELAQLLGDRHQPGARRGCAANLASTSFSPNGDGQEDTVTAWYCVSRDSTVTRS